MTDSDEQSPSLKLPHVWQYRPVRDIAVILVALLLLTSVYALLPVLTPLIFGFTLAYVTEPAVRYARHQWNWPRGLSASLIVLMAICLVTLATLWLGPKLSAQVVELWENLPQYSQWLSSLLGLPPSENVVESLREQFRQTPSKAASSASSAVGNLLGVVKQVLGTVSYWLTVVALSFCVFYACSVRFNRLSEASRFFPETKRGELIELCVEIDRVFASFFRGQLVVAVFTSFGFCIGFSLADVPYGVVIGLTGGLLSIIPFGQASGWILAILACWLEGVLGAVEFSWLKIFIYPSLVYAVTQSMETWVITPQIQGYATRMHPVAIMVVLFVGAKLGGLTGAFLAIPLLGTAKVLSTRYLIPMARDWADAH